VKLNMIRRFQIFIVYSTVAFSKKNTCGSIGKKNIYINGNNKNLLKLDWL